MKTHHLLLLSTLLFSTFCVGLAKPLDVFFGTGPDAAAVARGRAALRRRLCMTDRVAFPAHAVDGLHFEREEVASASDLARLHELYSWYPEAVVAKEE